MFLLKVRANRVCAGMTKFGHASVPLEDVVIPIIRPISRLQLHVHITCEGMIYYRTPKLTATSYGS